MNVPVFAVAKKPKPSQNSGGGSNALGKLLLGALCSMTPDAVACISGAVDGGHSSRSSYQSSGGSNYSSGSSSSNNGCSSIIAVA